MPYKIAGTANQDCIVKFFIGDKLIGYKNITIGAYTAVFPFFKYDDFTSLDPVFWTQVGNTYLSDNKIKLDCTDVGAATTVAALTGRYVWHFSGDFDIELFASSMVNGTNNSSIRMRARKVSNDAYFNDIAIVSATDLIYYRYLNYVETTLGTSARGDLSSIGLRLVRSGSDTSGYVINSTGAWSQLGSSDTLAIGSDDVFIYVMCYRWSSGAAASSILDYMTINSGTPIADESFYVTAVAEDNFGKVIGYGQVIPQYTTDAVDITLV